MDLGLRGRHAVVLGGTRGIGRAIAGTLAGEGAGVAVCARNVDQVMNAVAELQTLGVPATGASVDITDGAALKSWIANVAREFGGRSREPAPSAIAKHRIHDEAAARADRRRRLNMKESASVGGLYSLRFLLTLLMIGHIPILARHLR